ncbi:hypothetical protein MJO28_013271 [Puccinia striiformis f. sp. tritici]|uniref:Stress response RCI peptide n=2 Tax=Puccinia striiformis f. sp. tritici TaxID=168172 RepID=A0A0L0UUN1_9BASI|nr:hypothetical protein Pst134EB_024959 [Puccinia striiformis f. sp. tritici]KAI7940986.1 hypothetical protein MJO28_013271 [Puccinia striiformis f. sp. tritici]KNE90641.1 hypothetical protein PSTG_15904 [Puccinia striiformis f. sp. tritici PST-78]
MARSQPSSTTDILLYFLAIFVSPASVFIKRGCAADFWINIALFILGWIPGVIHAWWLIAKYPDPVGPISTTAHPHPQHHHHHHNNNSQYQAVPNYGAVPSAPPTYNK